MSVRSNKICMSERHSSKKRQGGKCSKTMMMSVNLMNKETKKKGRRWSIRQIMTGLSMWKNRLKRGNI